MLLARLVARLALSVGCVDAHWDRRSLRWQPGCSVTRQPKIGESQREGQVVPPSATLQPGICHGLAGATSLLTGDDVVDPGTEVVERA